MDKLLDGTWEEFEQWIRDTTENQEMAASLVLEDIKRSEGVLPEKNAFIERI